MPTKKTTKTDSKTSKILEKKVVSKSESTKDTTKKVVVKRRKTELKPTKASAVAIASQASRAKQALIEKVAASDIPYRKIENSNTKIPLWVWVFFWCSLFLFCVSFYKAIIFPQLGGNQVNEENLWFLQDWSENNYVENDDYTESSDYQNVNDYDNFVDEYDNNEVDFVNDSWVSVPETATETIQEFFARISDRNFDWAFDLMIPVLRNASEIRNHFTSFRMEPFLDWIQWWRLVPINFNYVSSPAYWKDTYSFDLSYVMSADWSQYDETWEFTVNMQWEEPKISSIRCATSKCSYHPIFWPENFGLMR